MDHQVNAVPALARPVSVLVPADRREPEAVSFSISQVAICHFKAGGHFNRDALQLAGSAASRDFRDRRSVDRSVDLGYFLYLALLERERLTAIGWGEVISI
ncbi:MAG: hypothetical protein H0U53_02530 [Actinobacteria bacterium]|nr:hypothetical protein [Actinomycetota bacterium]